MWRDDTRGANAALLRQLERGIAFGARTTSPPFRCVERRESRAGEHENLRVREGLARGRVGGGVALSGGLTMSSAIVLKREGVSWQQAHDELVFIVPKDDVDNAKAIVHREMTRPPSWAPDLPLTADIGIGASYGEAK